MSSEKMLSSVAYKKEPLLDDVEVAVPRRQRKHEIGKAWLIILVIGGLVAMALMFLGGFYAGRHHDDDKHHPPPPDQGQSFRLQNGDGTFMDTQALSGNQPAEDFLQCRSVSVNGQAVCMPGNPIVTSKGTVLLTVYQYNGQTSLIVSGSGDNYGENVTGSLRVARDTSSVKNRQIKLHVENFNGDISHPTSDSYHRALGMRHYSEPSKVSTPMSWNNLGSHAVILHLNTTNKKPVKIFFEHNYTTAENRLFGAILGGRNLSHFVFDKLPTTDRPLLFSPTSGHTAKENDDIDQPYERFAKLENSKFQKSQLFMQSLQDLAKDSVRNARSTSEQEKTENGVMFKMFDRQNPQKPLSTIRVIHDRRHGGANGTVMFDVTNHTTRCRAQFSTLYHRFLSDGNNLENATHHQTYTYHHFNASGHHLSMWQAVTPFDHPESSVMKPLVGQIPTDLPCIGDELGQLHNRLKSIMDDPSTTRSGRQLLWSCGFMDSLTGGYHCISGGYSCFSGLKDSHWKLSSLWGAGKTCLGAGQTCYNFFHNCW